MRESNFAFPAQNRACVCITSQLYDRRALDTNSPLPLLNSLTHLTYLTSTSPRIREILTCDGGLERLVRLLKDFCISPPPPENPAFIYGLSPPTSHRQLPVPVLNPKIYDRHAAYRFSLAFQCVVNIGVRGSEPIRSRVVQAGTLDVVGCVLESWLASKGFAVGPSSSASGLPRESREQRQLRRQQQRQRDQAVELSRLLAQQTVGTTQEDEDMSVEPSSREHSVATSDAETTVSTDTSANATPIGSSTPTGTVIVPGRERSGTVLGRPQWDRDSRQEQTTRTTPVQSRAISRHRTIRGGRLETSTPSTSTSRPETETEDDGEHEGDGDVEMSQEGDENIPAPTARTRPHLNAQTHTHARDHPHRRAVGIVEDSPLPTVEAGQPSDSIETDIDAHIIINAVVVDDAVMGVEDGIVSLDQNVNDDMAMGAPPGAPGAMDDTPRTRTANMNLNLNVPTDRRGPTGGPVGVGTREDLTPRAVLASLPIHTQNPVATTDATEQTDDTTDIQDVSVQVPVVPQEDAMNVTPPAVQRTETVTVAAGATGVAAVATTVTNVGAGQRHHHHRHVHGHHHILEETGPFREEDVLLSLQLLAYLSKYPHVRQAFYKQRISFHPATVAAMSGSVTGESSGSGQASLSSKTGTSHGFSESFRRENFFKTLTGRGKDKAPAQAHNFLSSTGNPNIWTPTTMPGASSLTPTAGPSIQPPRMTNVFALVERFTFRPSPNESALPNAPPLLPPEIQYWAGVIMRNACRKDETRGGIRQCANMLCGKWESFPREFAKCRRCRKAKYCGKECQSRAWSEGHRFWCSAREGEDGGSTVTGTSTSAMAYTNPGVGNSTQPISVTIQPPGQNRPRRLQDAMATDLNPFGGHMERIERRVQRTNDGGTEDGAQTQTQVQSRPPSGDIVPIVPREQAQLSVEDIRASMLASTPFDRPTLRTSRGVVDVDTSTPSSDSDPVTNQTPRASTSHAPITTLAIRTDVNATMHERVEAVFAELTRAGLTGFGQTDTSTTPTTGTVSRRRAGTFSADRSNYDATPSATSFPRVAGWWAASGSSTSSAVPRRSSEAEDSSNENSDISAVREHVMRNPLPIDRSDTIRAGPALSISSSASTATVTAASNPRARDAEMDGSSDNGDDMVIG